METVHNLFRLFFFEREKEETEICDLGFGHVGIKRVRERENTETERRGRRDFDMWG